MYRFPVLSSYFSQDILSKLFDAPFLFSISIFSNQIVTGHSTAPAKMNGCNDLEQLTEQFQSLCGRVPAAFKKTSQDQRSLEKHRLAVIKAAQDALKLLQTHDELATQQTWVVSGVGRNTSFHVFPQ
jgi:signal transduction histidine kinase